MSEEDNNPAKTPAQPPEDAGSEALSEALRSSFFIVKIVMICLVLVFLGSGFFVVGPQERAIVLRFGKPVGEGKSALLGPGLHWAFPPPIDTRTNIPYSEIQTVKSTVGWYLTTPELETSGREPPPGDSLIPGADGYTITGDGNIIHTRATLSYRVEDPIQYAFSFVNATNAIRDVLDNALLYASAHFSVDDALTRDKIRFRETVQARVNDLVRKQNLGIVVEQCQVETIPPRKLVPIFELVTVTLSAAETLRNTALAEQNQLVSAASSEAARRRSAAESDSARLLASIQADTNRFLALLPRYKADPGLVTGILLNETLSQVMTNVQGKWVFQNVGGGAWELRLQLSREPLAPGRPMVLPQSSSFMDQQ